MRHNRLGRTRSLHLRCRISTLQIEEACPSSRRYPPGRLHRVTPQYYTWDTHSRNTHRCENVRSYLKDEVFQCCYVLCVLWQLTCAPCCQRSTSVLILSYKPEAWSCGLASKWSRCPIRIKIEETWCRNKGVLLLYGIQASKHLNVCLVFGKLL